MISSQVEKGNRGEERTGRERRCSEGREGGGGGANIAAPRQCSDETESIPPSEHLQFNCCINNQSQKACGKAHNPQDSEDWGREEY